MRRILVIATALGVLVAASAAYAAVNTYSVNVTFTSKKAGSKHKPSPIGFTLDLTANGTNGNRTAPIVDIKTKLYGLIADGKDFPTCSLNKIAAAHQDTVCPKKAEVASGYITSTLGSSTDFTAPGSPCNPDTDVWNSGQGKLTFFFVDTPAHQCLGGAVPTGQVGPYPATYFKEGKYLVINVPVPSYVAFPIGGEAGSLETEHLKFFKASKKVHGKTVAVFASVGCKAGTRPYAQTLTSTLPPAGPAQENDTITKSGPC